MEVIAQIDISPGFKSCETIQQCLISHFVNFRLVSVVYATHLTPLVLDWGSSGVVCIAGEWSLRTWAGLRQTKGGLLTAWRCASWEAPTFTGAAATASHLPTTPAVQVYTPYPVSPFHETIKELRVRWVGLGWVGLGLTMAGWCISIYSTLMIISWPPMIALRSKASQSMKQLKDFF